MSTWLFLGWMYRDRQGQIVGPVTAEQLKHLIGTGEVQPTDRVWEKWAGQDQILLPELARKVYREGDPKQPF